MGVDTARLFPAFGQASVLVLALYLECVTTGAWVFQMRRGNERINFTCTNPLAVLAKSSKHPANAQKRERQKHSGEAWVAKKKATTATPAFKQAAVAAQAEATAPLQAAATAAPPAAATAAVRASAKQGAVATPPAATATLTAARGAPPLAATVALPATVSKLADMAVRLERNLA
jgi:hypothetical protein